MRVRGLKPRILRAVCSSRESHPMRVRGLKLTLRLVVLGAVESHPMRVRGLKHPDVNNNINNNSVAPHAGAWIETSCLEALYTMYKVAPHAGAWIETVDWNRDSNGRGRSHPMRVRGLKLQRLGIPVVELRRTPCGCVD